MPMLRYVRAREQDDLGFHQPGGPFGWLDNTPAASCSELGTETPSRRSDTTMSLQTPRPVQPPVAPTSVARIVPPVRVLNLASRLPLDDFSSWAGTMSFLALQPPQPDVMLDTFPTTRHPPPPLPPPPTLGTEPAERRNFQVRLRFWNNCNNWQDDDDDCALS